jgi:uncharacterized damage-inducible protein DinB
VDAIDVLRDMFGRLPGLVSSAVSGLSAQELAWAPAPGANSAAWLVWHLTRVQDAYSAQYLGQDQVWAGGECAARFGLDPDPADTGYGHTPEQVARVRPDSAQALIDYHDAVTGRIHRLLDSLDADALDEVVDKAWDPPVTLGVRLVSIADDAVQHAGQAAYVRGLPHH